MLDAHLFREALKRSIMADFRRFCCVSSGSIEDKETDKTNHDIDRELAKEKDRLRRTIKILLLGSGESGKTTLMKQMRIINGKDFQPEEMMMYKMTIYDNIVRGIIVLVEASRKMQMQFSREESYGHADFLFRNYDTRITEDLFMQYKPAVAELWFDRGIQEAFERRKEFHLGDSLKYFMENLTRISSLGYKPSNLDILHARRPTRCISEFVFDIKGVPFRFIDVGGQRSQRQKWYELFEDVTCILFLVSCSEFDQVLLEDKRTNRLVESCDIFDAIINNKTFANVSIILFLNKTDLLAEKIKKSSIKEYFPDKFPASTNPFNLNDVKKFQLELFSSRRRNHNRTLFHHFTTAIDTENIKLVFAASRETILEKHLKDLILL